MIKAYVNPSMGSRRLGDVKVHTLNAFYRDLRDFGRRNGDSNWRMYAYWLERRSERDGFGPKPREMAAACETTLDAAREAARRYRCGRVPSEHNPGLSPKSIKNIHVMMHKALGDAVAWGYLLSNPAAQAVVPRSRRRQRRVAGDLERRGARQVVNRRTRRPIRRHLASGRNQRHAAIGTRRDQAGDARPGRRPAPH